MTSVSAHIPRASGYRETERPYVLRAGWGPIMMGALTAIAAQFVFTVLGLAIGVTAADPDATNATVEGVTVAAGAWWLITGTIALMLGGMVYGRTSGLLRSTQLYLGALAMWAAVALFGFFVVWSGAGAAASAASPIALVSAGSFDTNDARHATDGITRFAAADGSTSAPSSGAHSREEALEAARTASWWAVVGLLVGAGAAVGGSCLGSRRDSYAAPTV